MRTVFIVVVNFISFSSGRLNRDYKWNGVNIKYLSNDAFIQSNSRYTFIEQCSTNWTTRTNTHTADKLAHGWHFHARDGTRRGESRDCFPRCGLRSNDHFRLSYFPNRTLKNQSQQTLQKLELSYGVMPKWVTLTCMVVLVSVRGTVALGRTEAADGAAAVRPFPIVAMIWPWWLRSSCGDTVWSCRPWAWPPASEAGLTRRGSVPITYRWVWNFWVSCDQSYTLNSCVMDKFSLHTIIKQSLKGRLTPR